MHTKMLSCLSSLVAQWVKGLVLSLLQLRSLLWQGFSSSPKDFQMLPWMPKKKKKKEKRKKNHVDN